MTNSPKFTLGVSILLALAICGVTLHSGRVVFAQLKQPSELPKAPESVAPQENPGAGKEPEPALVESSRAVDALKTARERIVRYQSIQAQILQKITFGERSFKSTGKYVQGSDLKLRLEFEFQVGDSTGSLLEVCDGEILWTHQRISMKPVGKSKDEKKPAEDLSDNKEIGSESSSEPVSDEAKTAPEDDEETKDDEDDLFNSREQITRRNVREILTAVNKAGALPENLLIAEIGLGGIPALLASVERTFLFDKYEEQTLDDKKFVMIEGGWKPEYLERWRNSEDGTVNTPVYVPDRVRVYFSADDYFPLRFVYLKRIIGRKAYLPIVSMNFNKVVVNGPVNEAEFQYEPPERKSPADVTAQYLQQLLAITPTASSTKTKETPDKDSSTKKFKEGSKADEQPKTDDSN